jgi:hypothetical protein
MYTQLHIYKNSIQRKGVAFSKLFGIALILATAIPFLVGAVHLSSSSFLLSIYTVISTLALIHVPMTVYLLWDHNIRLQM